MPTPFLASMQQALDLVKSGQLMEATLAIQHALGGMPVQAPQASANTAAKPDAERVVEGEVIRKTPASSSTATQPNETPFSLNVSNFLNQTFKPLPQLSPDLASTFSANTAVFGEVVEGAQWVTRTYSNAYGAREYKLYIPSTYQDKAMPLVVMLHGCTQSADDFAAGTAMNQVAETYGCLVAYPNQSTQANPNRCWNWFKPQDQRREQGEPAIIAGLTRAIMTDYAVDAQRVYVAGLSAGGAMAAIMATTYPDLYAAVGIHSGLASGSATDLLSALTAMRQGANTVSLDKQRFVPTIVLHGDQDLTVHAQNGEQIFTQARDRLKASNDDYFNVVTERIQPVNGHAYTCTRLQDASSNTQIEHWLIHGAGHAWSGGSSKGSYTDAKGPNASQAMLKFFLNHTL